MSEGADVKMKKSVVLTLLLISSFGLNVYLGINSFIKSTYTPSLDDQEILGEMTKMVIEHPQYKEIEANESIYAIKQGVSRFNVASPASLIHSEIYVATNKQTYIFNCIDEKCSAMEIGGWTYSRYSEEKPLLPLKK